MFRKFLVLGFSFATALSAMAADAPNTAAKPTGAAVAKLSAAQLVDKNIATRGGLKAWRGVQTMTYSGKMGAGGNQRRTLPVPTSSKQSTKLPVPARPVEEVQLPFKLEMQRPRKTRVELVFKGQTAVQVYDGTNGWKVRPYLNRNDVEPYTADETKIAAMQADIDGPLVDYAAKGTQVELEGMEKVEGKDNYKLKLTMKDGRASHVWIDATTFLESKIEGAPRRLDGKMHSVEIYYRDYREVSGILVPFVLETKVLPLEIPSSKVKELPIPTEKISIEKVEVNPKLDAAHFSKPQAEVAVAHR